MSKNRIIFTRATRTPLKAAAVALLPMTICDVANAAGVSADTVSRFERGHKLRPVKIVAICGVFEEAGVAFTEDDEAGLSEAGGLAWANFFVVMDERL